MNTIHTVKFKNLVIHIRPYFWHRSNGRIGARLDFRWEDNLLKITES